MFVIFAFAPAAILLDPVLNSFIAAATLGPLSAPRTRSEEIEPWDL